MLTRHQIAELVDVAREQEVGDHIIPALIGWADRTNDDWPSTPDSGKWYVECWQTRNVMWDLASNKQYYRAHKVGVALLAFAVGSDLSWQLADDVMDWSTNEGNESGMMAASALLDLVTDSCPV
jgi:hypothetical protein